MTYVYGPIPSRRLGKSLGIDTIPLKTCNWNCVYCQLGRTRPVVNQRKEFFPPEAILSEVQDVLAAHEPGEIDWVTFVGSGEPCLHAGTGQLLRGVKSLTDLPVAVITNGSLLYLPEVREELSAADAVLPSLDAGNAKLYRKINRPHPQFTFARLLEGLIAFRTQYTGRLWVEVMLVRGLNDTEEELTEIAEILREIGPDEVHLNVPTRPPAEIWIKPPDEEGLLRAMAILGDIAHVVHPVEGLFDLGDETDIIDAVLGIITRHPMRQDELERTLRRWSPGEVEVALDELSASGRAQVLERVGTSFWVSTGAYYPES